MIKTVPIKSHQHRKGQMVQSQKLGSPRLSSHGACEIDNHANVAAVYHKGIGSTKLGAQEKARDDLENLRSMSG